MRIASPQLPPAVKIAAHGSYRHDVPITAESQLGGGGVHAEPRDDGNVAIAVGTLRVRRVFPAVCEVERAEEQRSARAKLRVGTGEA